MSHFCPTRLHLFGAQKAESGSYLPSTRAKAHRTSTCFLNLGWTALFTHTPPPPHQHHKALPQALSTSVPTRHSMGKEQELCQGSTAGSISATAQPAKLEQECPDPWHGLTSASTSLLPPSTSQEPLPKPLGTGLGQCIPLSWVEVPTSSPRSKDAIFLESVLVAQQFLTLCDPMECSIPRFPVLYYLLGFAQTHVH